MTSEWRVISSLPKQKNKEKIKFLFIYTPKLGTQILSKNIETKGKCTYYKAKFKEARFNLN